ncbi:MAG TPA: hypothetical protein VJU15_02415 [Gemmatimonadales bacterium]|nr:hypothetical protein [Gemmatimonadales bacterium]
MHRSTAFFVRTALVALVTTLAACDDFFIRRGDDDEQGSPGSASNEAVAKKCGKMKFDTDHASTIKSLSTTLDVKVQIIPAKNSFKYKMEHLASKHGRIIAKITNTGNDAWDAMALSGESSSCWYVWQDKQGRLQSRFVSLPKTENDQVKDVADKFFDIVYNQPPEGHINDEAVWDKPYPLLASAEPVALDSIMRGGGTGWTTCLMNGCCRSRQ